MLFVLDRDGVINVESPAYIKSPEEWIPIPDSIDAIARLSQAGHAVVIMTNQAAVARKLLTLETLEKIHQKMQQAVSALGGKIDRIYFCPHHPDDHCACRKPQPGMLYQAQRDYHIPFDQMIFIGDSQRDLEAAQAVGCPFVLVKTGNGSDTVAKLDKTHSIPVFDDLSHAVDFYLKNRRIFS